MKSMKTDSYTAEPVDCKGCHASIYRDSHWNGLAWVRVWFKGDKQTGEFIQITHCPGCGEALLSDDDVRPLPF